MAPPSLLQDPTKRAARLRALIKRLEKGEHAQNRDIENVLTPEQRERFRQDMKEARKGVNQPAFPYPRELDRYFDRINKATFEYAKGERLKGRPSSYARYRAAEAMFDHAGEALGEIIDSADPATVAAIEFWLDRPVPRTNGVVDIGCSPADVPRKKGSRSPYARAAGPVVTAYDALRQVKVGHLQTAYDELRPKEPSKEGERSMADLRRLTGLVRR